MLRRSSAQIASTLRSSQVTRLIPNHTFNKSIVPFKLIATNFNGMRVPMSRQLSSTTAKINYHQRLNRFEAAVEFVTVGSAVLGTAGGVVMVGQCITKSDMLLFLKPFWFGVGATFFGAAGGIFGGISGAVCSVPIAFAVAFPVPAAGVATVAGVSLLAYKHLLFSVNQSKELVSSNTETVHSKMRFE